MKKLLATCLLSLLFVGCSDDKVASTLTVTGSSSAVATAFYVPKKIKDPLDNISNWLLPKALASFAGSPTTLKFSVYAFYVSTSTDCSSPILIQDNGTTPVEIDFYNSPTLFAGSPTAATYNCLIIKASDIIKYQPDATAVAAFPGVCSASVEQTRDLYRAPDTDLKDMNGATITATGSQATPSADIIYYYATTNSSALTNAPISMSVNQIVPLSAALVVPGNSIFYADFANGIEGDVGSPLECNLEGGTGFGFR